jgi:cell division protein FtsB
MRFFRILFNKYLLTAAAFIVLMLYFDQADWISQQARQRELQDVNDNISYLQQEVDRMDAEYKAIRTDPQALERYAREHYRMKRDTEDLYIVETAER